MLDHLLGVCHTVQALGYFEAKFNHCFSPVFLRQGAHATKDELTASAFLTVQLDRSLNDEAVQVSVFWVISNRACDICKF